MSLEVCVLGSGSSGNAVFLRSEATAMLIDAGMSCREIKRRLASIGEDVAGLAGICVSHEHSDHISGLPQLQKQFGISLFANSGTVEGASLRESHRACRWFVFSNGSAFGVGDLRVEPFSVPHDAYDPVGFRVECGGARVGVVTDAGIPTALMRQRLSDCDAVVIESNHDEQMVQDAERPWTLKQRILGRQGHLSNHQAGDVLEAVAGPRLRQVYLAHLSDECNEPELALRTARERLDGLGHGHVRVSLTWQDKVSERWSARETAAVEA